MRVVLPWLFVSMVGCSFDASGEATDDPSVDSAATADQGVEEGPTDTSVEPDAGADPDATLDATPDAPFGGDAPDDAGKSDVPSADAGAADTAKVDATPADTGAADTAKPDVSPADSGMTDAAKPDTAVADTFVADTFVADTFVADTFVADTFVADTGVSDAFGPDASLPDVGRPDGAGLPVLACALLSPSPTGVVTLSSAPVLGWAHWGNEGVPTAWNRKAGSTDIAQGTLGPSSTSTTVGSTPLTFSWTGGMPTPTATGVNQWLALTKKNDSYSFSIDGDPGAERTFVVYSACNNSSTGRIDIATSDGSSAAYSSSDPACGSSTSIFAFSCNYRPAVAAAVKITLTQTSNNGSVGLLAATVRLR